MRKLFIFLFCSLAILSCKEKQSNDLANANVPKVIEAKGVILPKDSISEPVSKAITEYYQENKPAGKPVVALTNTNISPAAAPKAIPVGAPDVHTPGKDSFAVPKILPAIDSPYTAGVPEMVVVKDASSKDKNPQNFSSFSVLQGLRDNSISSLLEDKSGALWIGHHREGITKYDGKNFTHFGAKEGLMSGANCLLQDRSGNVWVARDGATRYDGKNFTWYGYEQGFSMQSVSCMVEDQSGNIWFGTNGDGAVKYDGKSFIYFRDLQGVADSVVSDMEVDQSGNIWMVTSGGISKYDGVSFSNFSTKQGFPNDILKVFEDKSGSLWFGTLANGVVKFDGKTLTNFTTAEGLSSNEVREIMQDKNGNMWFGTSGGGLTKFDGKVFTYFTDKEGLPSMSVTKILEDRSGNLWIGTESGGLCKFGGMLFTHFTYEEGMPKNDGVYDILEDKAGNLWFGTGGGGVSKYDGKSFTNYGAKEGLNDNVISITEDHEGNFWFGTIPGIIKYNGKTFTLFKDTSGRYNGFVFASTEDKAGNLWYTTAGGGIRKYDGSGFTTYTYGNGLLDNFFRCMIKDKAGNIWLGTRTGVSKYDGKSFTNFTEKEGLINDAVTGIAEDISGNIWIATRQGLTLYNGKSFINFTEKEGLLNNSITGILADRSGNVWIGSGSGLSKLSREKLSILLDKIKNNTLKQGDIFFKNYRYEDGFLGIGVTANAIYEDSKGTIWVGANDRLTAYHPSSENERIDTLINIQVTGIRLFNENIYWPGLLKGSTVKDTSFSLSNGVKVGKFKFSGLSKWYNLPDNLSLAYNNNFLTFSFIGITMNQPGAVKYQYKLEGIDDNWSGITSSTEAPYGNLPPGNYTFKVKAMNSDGYWTKEFDYIFKIRPPWWKTGWAYTIYAGLFLIALWSFIKWRLRILKKEKKLLEEKIEMQQALFNERLRISRELHDEVGATLSGIAMYSHLAKEQIKEVHVPEVEKSLTIMQQSAGEMVNKLNDIVWLVNPEQDTLQKLVDRLEEYARDMGAIKNMQVKINILAKITELNIPVESRRNIYLFCKEAINNAVKYSLGSLLELTVKETDNKLEFSVSDNGKGFDAVMVRRGNGLENMQKRADEIGAKLILQSKVNEGAFLSLQCEITH